MKLAGEVAAALVERGADTVFGVPGGGANLDLVGAAQAAGLRFVLAHGETNGAIMASTYGLLTGRPAMAIATRGPGVTASVNGAAQATLDRFPLLLVTDCVPAGDRERVAHQRVDQRSVMRPVTKWSGTIGADDAAADTARAALELAARAPRGAVHLDFDPAGSSEPVGRSSPTTPSPTTDRDRVSALLASAARPVVIAGIECVDDADAVLAGLERLGCPVLTTYQAVGLLPPGHPQRAGLYTSGAVERPLLSEADLVIAVGLDTVEPMPTPWGYDAPVVSISNLPPASTFLPADIALTGPVATLLGDLAGSAAHGWTRDAGAVALERTRSTLGEFSGSGFGPVDLTLAVARAAPPGVTATVDAGAHFLAIMPFWNPTAVHRLLISNGLATMGFALPAAIGAALARPGEPVVCLVGDGGLGMTLAELETVARLRLPITVVVFDDAALSLIEVKQRPGQGGEGAVRYRPVDFAGVAQAMGVEAHVATDTAHVERLVHDGWDRPRLIDARIDPSPYAGLIRATRG
ncbi:MAG TPA: thiamine pyrophosphate-binding protein [Ilumatobacter sp.]